MPLRSPLDVASPLSEQPARDESHVPGRDEITAVEAAAEELVELQATAAAPAATGDETEHDRTSGAMASDAPCPGELESAISLDDVDEWDVTTAAMDLMQPAHEVPLSEAEFFEEATCEDVAREDVAREDVAREDVAGEDGAEDAVAGERVASAVIPGESVVGAGILDGGGSAMEAADDAGAPVTEKQAAAGGGLVDRAQDVREEQPGALDHSQGQSWEYSDAVVPAPPPVGEAIHEGQEATPASEAPTGQGSTMQAIRESAAEPAPAGHTRTAAASWDDDVWASVDDPTIAGSQADEQPGGQGGEQGGGTAGSAMPGSSAFEFAGDFPVPEEFREAIALLSGAAGTESAAVAGDALMRLSSLHAAGTSADAAHTPGGDAPRASSSGHVAPPSTLIQALERVADRIRRGDVVLPSDLEVSSDEAALATTLAALLRKRST